MSAQMAPELARIRPKLADFEQELAESVFERELAEFAQNWPKPLQK